MIIAAVLGAGYHELSLHQNESNPSPSPTTSSTPFQAATVTPNPSNASSNPLVTITYHNQMEPNGSGLFMDLSIMNDGYKAFSTDPTKIFAVSNDNKYAYSKYWTQIFGDGKPLPYKAAAAIAEHYSSWLQTMRRLKPTRHTTTQATTTSCTKPSKS